MRLLANAVRAVWLLSRYWTWHVAMYPKTFVGLSFLAGALTVALAVFTNADSLYQLYWQAWVYRP